MKVVALTSSFPFNSSDERSVFIKRLYDAVAIAGAKSGLDLTVVAPHPFQGELGYNFQSLAGQYQAFGDAGLLRTITANPAAAFGLGFAISEFNRIITQLKPDVVHANWSFAGIAAALSGFKSVVTLRGSDVQLLRYPGLRELTAVGLSNASVFTAVGAALAEEASRALGRSVIVIENGTELISPEPISTPEHFFLSVGTVIERKGTLDLVRAFARFAQSNESHHLVIAGRLADLKYVNKIRLELSNLGLEGRVHLLGGVSPGQVTTLLSRALAFCSFAVWEGRPNAVLEAQVAGIPCVVSDIPAHRELAHRKLAQDRDILVDPSDVSAASDALQRSLSLRRDKVIVAASSKWDVCAEKYIDLYGRLVRSTCTVDLYRRRLTV